LKGTYILQIYIKTNIDIIIGALGNISFFKGDYLYIGSAMAAKGSSTLINRVKRHTLPSDSKKKHWHIDYFLENKEAILTKIYLIPSSVRLECIFAQELLALSDGFIKDFGSSDCNCKSHLVYFKCFIGFS